MQKWMESYIWECVQDSLKEEETSEETGALWTICRCVLWQNVSIHTYHPNQHKQREHVWSPPPQKKKRTKMCLSFHEELCRTKEAYILICILNATNTVIQATFLTGQSLMMRESVANWSYYFTTPFHFILYNSPVYFSFAFNAQQEGIIV